MVVSQAQRAEAAVTQMLSSASNGSVAACDLRTALEMSRAIASKLAAFQARAAASLAARESHGDGGTGVLRRATGVSRRQAEAQARTVRVLDDLPVVRDALEAGRVSFNNAARLAEAAEAVGGDAVQADAELLSQAESVPDDQFAREARRWAARQQPDDGEAGYARQRKRRWLRIWDGDDGMTHLRGEFDPVTGERIRNRVEVEARRVRQAEGRDERRSFAQAMADALDGLTTVGSDVVQSRGRARGGQARNSRDRPNQNNGQNDSPNRDSRSDGRDRDSRSDGQDRDSRSDGQDRDSRSDGQDRDSRSDGQDRDSRSDGQDRDSRSDGQDRDSRSDGQDRDSRSDGQDRDSRSDGQDRDSRSDGQDRDSRSDGQDRDSRSDGQDRDSRSDGRDRGGGSDGAAVADSVHRGRPIADIAVVSYVDSETGGLVSQLATGEPLPPSVLDMLACNASITGILYDTAGTPLWRGTTKRTATASQIRALIARDGGCVGCGCHPALCQAHHIKPAFQGGPTTIANMALLCWDCHHKVHHHQWTVARRRGRFELLPPVRTRWGPARAPDPPPSALPPALPAAQAQGDGHAPPSALPSALSPALPAEPLFAVT